MEQTEQNNYLKPAIKLLCLIMGLVFSAQLLASLQWRQYLDTPLLNYAGYLINEHGLTPYRDIFETSMPGTLLFHSLIGKLFGYSDLAVRILDSAFLVLAVFLIYFFLSRFSRTQGVFGALLFGLTYQSLGPQMALQRDFIGIIAVLAALILAGQRLSHLNPLIKIFFFGFLVGIGACFKPHLIVFIVPLLWLNSRGFSSILAVISGSATSFSIPLLWVFHLGGLNDFFKIFFNYLPLHTQISHDFTIIQWPQKFWYCLSGIFLLNDFLPLTLATLVILLLANRLIDSQSKNDFKVIVLLSALGFFYPAISGQFWFYHWSPFLLFACISCSFSVFLIQSFPTRPAKMLTFGAILILVAQTGISSEFSAQLKGELPSPPLGGVPDQICSYLKQNLKPGMKVQSLDWVNGAIHGMLLAKVQTASRFLYDYHFFHHVSNPFIAGLRSEFIETLKKSPPDLFIYVFLKSRVSGPDTAQDFPELGRFLFENYEITLQTERFGIFKRKNQ